jgi:hypothetical protein
MSVDLIRRVSPEQEELEKKGLNYRLYWFKESIRM